MKKFTFLILLTTYFLFSCAKKNELSRIEGFAQGTTYHITFALKDKTLHSVIEKEINNELNRLDAAISNYRNDSTIEQLNAQLTTEPLTTTEEIVQLVEIAREVNKASHGCYDLTIKPLFDLWGFKKDKFNLPDDDVLRQTLTFIGMDKLTTVNRNQLRKTLANLRLDLSSIGQGYSVGRIAWILEQHQVNNYIVEIGGELTISGKKPDGTAWRVALEKPLPNERRLEKIVVFNSDEPMSLMTSGTYRHYFDKDGKRFSHILDARNGKPVEHNTLAVTVLHQNPTVADAWSTALLCLGSKEGITVANENNIAALYIDQEGEILTESKTRSLDKMHHITLYPAKPD
ncbi:MAG: FAD:protein FMN transferase [Pseudomonadota bacterium]